MRAKHWKCDDGSEEGYNFKCPGCRCRHSVRTGGTGIKAKVAWAFSGTVDRPTFSPSILCNPHLSPGAQGRCHSFVREGRIEFLDDSGHELAGQTVDLPDIE
jgi:hypothetical protein